ncbi:MAG TPA: NAD(P)H-binding protein [Phycisphaerae bacterium]
MVATSRTALLAGATGLVGRALLSLLLASKHYRSVHVLLRRTPRDIGASEKPQIHQVDFTRLPAPFPTIDDVFIALGTTIKIAGSEAAFRQVDFDFVVNVARAARAAGATRLAVVSALGADLAHLLQPRERRDGDRGHADRLRIGGDRAAIDAAG